MFFLCKFKPSLSLQLTVRIRRQPLIIDTLSPDSIVSLPIIDTLIWLSESTLITVYPNVLSRNLFDDEDTNKTLPLKEIL